MLRRDDAEAVGARRDDGQLRDRLSPRAASSTSPTRSAAGVAGAIVPDLLVEEADELANVCRQAATSA